jgi:hypothetical protein
MRGEALGNRLSDSTGSSGNDSDPAVHIEVVQGHSKECGTLV